MPPQGPASGRSMPTGPPAASEPLASPAAGVAAGPGRGDTGAGVCRLHSAGAPGWAATADEGCNATSQPGSRGA
eukprot:1000792-Alexandrium_andersonii.AAC.1